MSSPSAWNGPLGLAPLGFLDLAPVPLLRTAAAAGFNSVALRARAAVPGGPQYPLLAGSAMLREIGAAMAQTGVHIDLIELVSLHRDEDLEGVRGLLECAASIGALRVLCTGDDTDRHVVVRKFAQLCDMAAPRSRPRIRAGRARLPDPHRDAGTPVR
jgi:sugar phosphate isomerase/epimerase